MKQIQLFVVVSAVVGILLLFSIMLKHGKSFNAASWIGKTDFLNRKTIRNYAHLKVFEKQIRRNFVKFSSTLTQTEKDEYEHCVTNVPTLRSEEMKRWQNSKGDEMRFRHLSYLTKDSVVLEIGGNLGHDATNILDLYGPVVVTLEPIEKFAKELDKNLKDKGNVMVLNFGLGNKTEEIFVSTAGTGTSAFSDGDGDTRMIIVNTTEFLLQFGVEENDIDLLLINCEGCEYEVLEAILSTSLVENIRNIQFQAHYLPRVKKLEERYCRIEELLKRTHVPTFHFLFVWEHWRRKDLL